MSAYPKKPYVRGAGSAPSVPSQDRLVHTKGVNVRRAKPGTVILIHGVNDVGTAYSAIEAGICRGLNERLSRLDLASALYRMPNAADRKTVIENPDAVFFRRSMPEGAHSPVIPFYWGFREDDKTLVQHTETSHGQSTDRFGNRLDRDGSKGGGPFNNATSALPDLWNESGKQKILGVLDLNSANGDPLRPVFDSPARSYMVLAAERMAMLIGMIRRYDPSETISIIGHSQGCLISLVAQALLAERGERPADCLVLNNPPFGLAMPFMEAIAVGLDRQQTVRARIETLVNIVQAVSAGKAASPEFATLGAQPSGLVGKHWSLQGASRVRDGRADLVFPERDNRGRVYLYFCPQDMTVGLQNVQGIGWQGVPATVFDDYRYDQARAAQLHQGPGKVVPVSRESFTYAAMTKLRSLGFFQRMFALEVSEDGRATGRSHGVGEAPREVPLRIDGQRKTTTHVDKDGRTLRTPLPHEMREINAPALPEPFRPDLLAGDAPAKPGPDGGPREHVDPIDAAIATTNEGMDRKRELIADPLAPRRLDRRLATRLGDVPGCFVRLSGAETRAVYNALWGGKRGADVPARIEAAWAEVASPQSQIPSGKLYIVRDETPNEARLRWQQSSAPKSFHGAIFGNQEIHRNVTAYDIAIGQGKAVTDPEFYDYLCEVADWRMKTESDERERETANARTFVDFSKRFDDYFAAEPPKVQQLIRDTVTYYSNGTLPKLPDIPRLIVNETRRDVDRRSPHSQASAVNLNRGKA